MNIIYLQFTLIENVARNIETMNEHTRKWRKQYMNSNIIYIYLVQILHACLYYEYTNSQSASPKRFDVLKNWRIFDTEKEVMCFCYIQR